MSKFKYFLCLIFLLGFTINISAQSIPANSPAGINGQLKVIGTKLCNQYGNPIQLRGMSTHGLQWFYNDCYSSTKINAFNTLKDWGADILRISMYVQEGGYETNPALFTQRVKALIDIATERGMYALIDFHQLDPGNPNYNLQSAKTFFTEIATSYKNQTNILYDICNEPNNTSWSEIKTYADQIIPLIKNIDNDAVITVGTNGWASFGYSDGESYNTILNNQLNYSNVMYSFHFYADSHRDDYLNILDIVSDQVPVFVTEFGFQNYAGEGANNRTMTEKYITLMRNKKISWCNWNYSDDNRSGAVWKSGTCASNNWNDSNLKESGIWIKSYIGTPADDFAVTPPATVTIKVSFKDQLNNAIAGVTAVLTKTSTNTNVTAVSDVNGNVQFPNTISNIAYALSYSKNTYTFSPQTIAIASGSLTSNVTYNVVGSTQPNVSSVLIQAENYFYMSGIQTEPTTDTGGGLNVGYADTGDWMSYKSINFPTTGLYLIEYRVASAVNGAKLSADLNAGSIQLGALNVPNTGGWQNWQTISHTVNINAGTYDFGIFIQNSGVNLNWIKITKVNNPLAKEINNIKEVITIYPNPVENVLNFNVNITNSRITIVNTQTGVYSTVSKINDRSIDVSSLESGIYSIIFEDGAERSSVKFIKK